MFLLVAPVLFNVDISAQTPEYVDIGALIPKSGNLADLGIRWEAATQFGVERFNQYLEDKNADWRLRLADANILDTKSDTDAANDAARTLTQTNQIEYIIGPARSSAVEQIRQTMENEDWSALFISCCSTASEIAIQDTIFRLTPADDKQGPHIAKFLHNEGKQVMIPMWINDPYGNGLVKSTVERFKELGNIAVYSPQTDQSASFDATSEIMAYKECSDKNGSEDGKANPTCDNQFTEMIQKLNDIVTIQILSHGADKVSILYVGFNTDDIARQAMQYPALKLVQWVGADASVSPSLVSDENLGVRDFLHNVNFRATTFSLEATTQAHSDVTKHLEEKFPGAQILSYAYSSYDAAWAIGLAIEQTRVDSVNVTVQNVTDRLAMAVENHPNPALGTIKLDKYGDIASASYDVYGIESDTIGVIPAWHKIGTFNPDGLFAPSFRNPLQTINIGILLNTENYGSNFNDGVFGVTMQQSIRDWNEANTQHEIRPYTISISDGPLAALNTLHSGIYDDFYHPKLNKTIHEATSTYDGSFDISGKYIGMSYYPFVIDSQGMIVQDGINIGSEDGHTQNADIDEIPGSDRTAEQMFDLFRETNGPKELWWQYEYGSPAIIKRSLLIYHEESNSIVGAGYHPILGGDTQHNDTLRKVIQDAEQYVKDNGNDVTSLNGIYDIKTADLPFYSFVIAPDRTVVASSLPTESVGRSADLIPIIGKTIDQIEAELDDTGKSWASYFFYNHLTGIAEVKRGLFERAEINGTEYTFGTGYHPYQKISYFVGPSSSGNLEPIIDYINENDYILISPTSTAPSLGKPDNVFRLSPPDTVDAIQTIHQMRDDNKKHIILVQRDDVWANGFADIILSHEDMVFYDINDGTNNILWPVSNIDSFDFDTYAKHLDAQIQETVTKAGSEDRVGILYITFSDNFVRFLNAVENNADISDDSGIFSVKYYGTNSMIDSILPSNANASKIAKGAGITATSYNIPDNEISLALKDTLQKLGIQYTSYYFASAYDAVMLLGDAVSSTDSVTEAVQKIASTNQYLGALDNNIGISLDASGDLVAHPEYNSIYELAQTGNQYTWQQRDDVCSVVLSESSVDFGSVNMQKPQSNIQNMTFTNDGTTTIRMIDAIADDYADATVMSSLVEFSQDGQEFERLLGKKTLATGLEPGEAVTIQYRMNIQYIQTDTIPEEIIQNISYRITCDSEAS